MPINYVADIRMKSSSQLGVMLQSIASGVRILNWPLGTAFEHVILRAFEIEGATIRWPFEVQHSGQIVEQIDGAVHCDGHYCLVESKDYGTPINIEPIAKLRNQLMRRPEATLGLVFARSGFTQPAKVLTRINVPLNVILWEFREIQQAVNTGTMRQALQTKFYYAVEEGMPDYNILGGLR